MSKHGAPAIISDKTINKRSVIAAILGKLTITDEDVERAQEVISKLRHVNRVARIFDDTGAVSSKRTYSLPEKPEKQINGKYAI